MEIDTGERPLNQYQFSLYLAASQSGERLAMQNLWPYQDFNLYPSDRWQPVDALLVPLSYAVPANLAAGAYRLGIIVYDTEAATTIALRAEDVDDVQVGWLRVGEPPVVDSVTGQAELLVQDAVWENGIVLRRLTPQVVEGGRQLAIAVEWQTSQSVLRDLTVFVHLIDETGVIVAQSDRRPFGGQFPTPTWLVGETLRDTIYIDLPAARHGNLGLSIGLYDQAGRVGLAGGLRDSLAVELPIPVNAESGVP